MGVIEVVHEMLGARLEVAASACVVELLRRSRRGAGEWTRAVRGAGEEMPAGLACGIGHRVEPPNNGVHVGLKLLELHSVRPDAGRQHDVDETDDVATWVELGHPLGAVDLALEGQRAYVTGAANVDLYTSGHDRQDGRVATLVSHEDRDLPRDLEHPVIHDERVGNLDTEPVNGGRCRTPSHRSIYPSRTEDEDSESSDQGDDREDDGGGVHEVSSLSPWLLGASSFRRERSLIESHAVCHARSISSR